MGSTYEVLGYTVGVDTNTTGEGVVCGLSLFWWIISPLKLPGNIYDLRVIPIQEVTEDIASIFLLLYDDVHTGVDQDGVYDTGETDDDSFVMDDINEYESVSCA